MRRLTSPLLTVVCVLALASCGGEPADDLPEFARGDTEQSAQNFVTFWVNTLNAATTSGDTARLEELSTDECRLCTDFIQRLDKIYGAGGHVETDGFDVRSTAMEGGFEPDHAGLFAVLDSAPQTVVEKDGAEPEEHTGGELRMRFVLGRQDGHWVVTDLIPS